MPESDRDRGRRDFLKAAGAAAAGAVPLGGGMLAAGVATTDKQPIHPRPFWVRAVGRPVLGETTPEYQRFSGADIFTLYPTLKDEREGDGAFKDEQAVKEKRATAWIRKERPGFSLRDVQLYNSSWTVMGAGAAAEGLLSWTRIGVPTPDELGVEPYAAAPEDAARTIKAAARLFGASLVGITWMDERFVNLREHDKDIVFEEAPEPEITSIRMVIPKKMKWVVAIGVQMSLDLIRRGSTALSGAASGLGYSQCAFVVSSLAEFIRGLGYQAIPSVNDTAQSVPFALDAGLGELGRTNRLITPEFGPVVRLCKVFTDLPLACDRPVAFGVLEFCKRCRKCAEACPVGAISLNPEPSFKTSGPWNNPGHRAWFEDSYKCYRHWQQAASACSLCLAACPYAKADRAWIHGMVKATTSMTPLADGFFRTMDDVFGYGRALNATEWWQRDWPAFDVDTTRGTGR